MADHDIDLETVRPFRIYHANMDMWVRWRYFSNKARAHIGALVELRWGRVGDTFEVVDVSTGKALSAYTRRANGFDIVDYAKFPKNRE